MEPQIRNWCCYVVGCKGGKEKGKGRKFKISRFASEEVRGVWLEKIPQLENQAPFDFLKDQICELHFEQKYILKLHKVVFPGGEVYTTPRTRWKLSDDAIPTKFLDITLPKDGKLAKKRKMVGKSKPIGNNESLWRSDRVDVSSKFPRSQQQLKGNLQLNGHVCLSCYKLSFGTSGGLGLYAKERREGYIKFTQIVSGYLRLNKPKDMCDIPAVLASKYSRVGHSLTTTLCRQCWKAVKSTSELLWEMEQLKIKLDYEILKLSNVLKHPDVASNQKHLKNQITVLSFPPFKFTENFATAGSKLLEYPKVLLNRIGCGQQRKRFKPTTSTQATVPVRLNPDFVCGTGSITRLLGPVFRCSTCEKTFFSSDNLNVHFHRYHSEHTGDATVTFPEYDNRIETSEMDDVHTDSDSSSSTCGSSPVLNPESVVSDDNPQELPCEADYFEDDSYQDCKMEDRELPNIDEPDKDNRIHDTVQTANDDCVVISNSNQTTSENMDVCLEIRTSDRLQAPVVSEQEIKTEEEETNEGAPKKVPFMSSEYMGKYRVVCKLKNIKSGETIIGVIGKTTENLPKVISVEKPKLKVTKKDFKKPENVKITGPPFACPIPDCLKQYITLRKCRSHHLHHKKILKKKLLKEKTEREREREYEDQDRKLRNTGKGNPDDLSIVSPDIQSGPVKFAKKGSKMKYCQVEGCHSRFFLQESLDYHMKSHSELQCKFCSLVFVLPSELLTHEIGHNEELNTDFKESSCPRCEVISETFKNLKVHYFSVHLKIMRPRRPHGVKHYHCPSCDKSYFSLVRCLEHRQRVHKETIDLPISCPDCDKKFENERSLRLHKNAHTRSHKRVELKCNICPRKFVFKHKYEQHMRAHNLKQANSNFLCPECGKLIKSMDYFKAHLEIHKGEKTFVCDVCGVAYSLKRQLSLHIKTKHRKD